MYCIINCRKEKIGNFTNVLNEFVKLFLEWGDENLIEVVCNFKRTKKEKANRFTGRYADWLLGIKLENLYLCRIK